MARQAIAARIESSEPSKLIWSAFAMRRISATRCAVVARHEGSDLRDSRRAGVGDQLRGERRADPTALVLVGDREGDLGATAVANEACDRDRLRVALDVRDERMTGPVDRGQLRAARRC